MDTATPDVAGTVNMLDVVVAVVAARGGPRPDAGPFPDATNKVHGTAFAISRAVSLTAGYVVQSAIADGDLALAHLALPLRILAGQAMGVRARL
jgi:hypothetical protein